MGRYSYSNRPTESESLCLDTQWLKVHGYFCGYKNGGITWTNGFGNQSSINFCVDTRDYSPKITFNYTIGKEKHMRYSYSLVKVPCNIGEGFRWAFKCGLYVNDVYCGRSVYKLYSTPRSEHFGCRHCMRLVYESQRRSRSSMEHYGKAIEAEAKAWKLWEKISKWTYRGRPTRKAKQYQRLMKQVPPLKQMAIMECDLLLNRHKH